MYCMSRVELNGLLVCVLCAQCFSHNNKPCVGHERISFLCFMKSASGDCKILSCCKEKNVGEFCSIKFVRVIVRLLLMLQT